MGEWAGYHMPCVRLQAPPAPHPATPPTCALQSTLWLLKYSRASCHSCGSPPAGGSKRASSAEDGSELPSALLAAGSPQRQPPQEALLAGASQETQPTSIPPLPPAHKLTDTAATHLCARLRSAGRQLSSPRGPRPPSAPLPPRGTAAGSAGRYEAVQCSAVQWHW